MFRLFLSSLAAFSFVIVPSLLLFTPTANAGVIEIGASGSYRKQNIDVDAYDESKAITGSLSYYFSEASAIEASYTDGQNRRSISSGPDNYHNTSLSYKSVGLDLVYTIGDHEAMIRPYIKVGAQYILEKKLTDQYKQQGQAFAAQVAEDQPALVPSAGFGFKMGLTEALSLKAGIDGWASRPLNQPPVTVDFAARVGLSWMF